MNLNRRCNRRHLHVLEFPGSTKFLFFRFLLSGLHWLTVGYCFWFCLRGSYGNQWITIGVLNQSVKDKLVILDPRDVGLTRNRDSRGFRNWSWGRNCCYWYSLFLNMYCIFATWLRYS